MKAKQRSRPCPPPIRLSACIRGASILELATGCIASGFPAVQADSRQEGITASPEQLPIAPDEGLKSSVVLPRWAGGWILAPAKISYNITGLVRQMIMALAFSLTVTGKIDVDELTERAEAGDVAAAVALGEAYFRGTGVARDLGKACALFQGASKESVEARAWLGICLIEGSGVPKDETTGLAMVRQAAESGNAVGQRLYASCFKWNDGMVDGVGTAVRWLKKSAEQGDAKAQGILADAYARGCGVEIDRKAAMKWYQAAAELGDPEARAWLGQSYLLGRGVGRDPGKAVAIFQMLVKEEEPLGYRHLATSFLDGWGVPKDEQRGSELMMKAAEMGDFVAQRAIAECYLRGVGVEQDFTAALKWTRRFTRERPWATGALAEFYLEGNGVKRDPGEAARLFLIAAEAGDHSSQLRLAQMLSDGDGVAPDAAEAARWLQRSAENGNVEAAAKMARALILDRGIQQDQVEGLAWALVVARAARTWGADSPSCQDAFQQVREFIEAAPADRMKAATTRTDELSKMIAERPQRD